MASTEVNQPLADTTMVTDLPAWVPSLRTIRAKVCSLRRWSSRANGLASPAGETAAPLA